MRTAVFLPMVAGCVGLAIAPFAARATFETRVMWHAASLSCDATNPEFDPSLRRQVNALRNVGTEMVVVTCGTMTDNAITNGMFSEVRIYLQNHRGVEAQASCTLHAGAQSDIAAPQKIKKTVVVAGGATGSLVWTAAEYYEWHKHAVIVCNLPIRWSVRDVAVTYDEYVGE